MLNFDLYAISTTKKGKNNLRVQDLISLFDNVMMI